jgi:hypothetical protein
MAWLASPAHAEKWQIIVMIIGFPFIGVYCATHWDRFVSGYRKLLASLAPKPKLLQPNRLFAGEVHDRVTQQLVRDMASMHSFADRILKPSGNGGPVAYTNIDPPPGLEATLTDLGYPVEIDTESEPIGFRPGAIQYDDILQAGVYAFRPDPAPREFDHRKPDPDKPPPSYSELHPDALAIENGPATEADLEEEPVEPEEVTDIFRTVETEREPRLLRDSWLELELAKLHDWSERMTASIEGRH